MERLRLIAAGLIFLLLTAVKFLFPSAFGGIQDAVGSFIDRDFDYISAFARISNAAESVLAPPAVSSPAAASPGSTAAAVLPTADKLRRVIYIGGMPAPKAGPEDGEAEVETSEPDDELSRRVAAFLENQSAYSEYDLPENVSYDPAKLEFDCTSPVSGISSSGFGYREHPILGGVRFHYGTDFAAASGEEIHAFASGVVIQAGLSDSYGNYIILSHPNGFQTLYAHCSSLLAASGDKVSLGDVIALVGDTGQATGPHLHFELTENGVYLNPEYYVNG